MNTWKSGISPNLQRFERQGLKSWFLKGLLKAPLLLLFLFPLLLLRHCTRTLLGNLRNRGRNRRFRNRR